MVFAAFAILLFVLVPAAAIWFGVDSPERETRPLQW